MNAQVTPITTPEILTQVEADHVAEAIQAAGCAVSRIEHDGVVRLHSASHGVGFQVLWGNTADRRHFADFTLSCPVRVQGDMLPDTLLAEWQATKRFARVARHGNFLVLEMDVLAAGGVTRGHLAVSLQLWTQMMGEFFVFLRNQHTADAAEAPAEERAAA